MAGVDIPARNDTDVTVHRTLAPSRRARSHDAPVDGRCCRPGFGRRRLEDLRAVGENEPRARSLDVRVDGHVKPREPTLPVKFSEAKTAATPPNFTALLSHSPRSVPTTRVWVMDNPGMPMTGFVRVRATEASGKRLEEWVELAASFVKTLPRNPPDCSGRSRSPRSVCRRRRRGDARQCGSKCIIGGAVESAVNIERHLRRHLVPRPPVQFPAGLLLVRPAPLLEVEHDALAHTLVADRPHPVGVQRPRSPARLAPPQSASRSRLGQVHRGLRAAARRTGTARGRGRPGGT